LNDLIGPSKSSPHDNRLWRYHDIINCYHADWIFQTAFLSPILHKKEGMKRTDLTVKQKKDWAKLLYTKEHLTQAEIAERVGVSRVSMSRWVTAEKWEMLKVSITMTNEEQLKNLYRQLAELNKTILEREEKARCARPAEATAIKDLTASIRNLRTDMGLDEIITVTGNLIEWVRTYQYDRLKEITVLVDAYVQSKIA
jgi:transcriptional regulator with XRE-family HTH domain